MIILFASGEAGKQGKSTLACHLYHYLTQIKGYDYEYITNDKDKCVADLDALVAPNRFTNTEEGDIEINDTIDGSIFDWGGKSDSRVVDIAQAADCVVLPCNVTGTHEAKQAIENIWAYSKYNKNIVIVINNSLSPGKEEARKLFEEACEHPILEIPRSRYFDLLASNDITIFEAADTNLVPNGAHKAMVRKKIIPLLTELCETITGE